MNVVQTPRTERNFDQIVADYEMFKRAKAIREWLSDISGLIPRLNEGPNPYYNATVDGLTLVHYYGGPSLIGTPFGGWAATGGGCLKDHNWLEKATDRLGLELIFAEYQNNQGCYGPVHAITKDLDGEPLPKTDWRHSHIGIGMVSESVFGNSMFINASTGMLDFESMQRKIRENGVTDEGMGGYLKDFKFPEGWLPDRIYAHMAYELNKHLWEHKVKPAIGFIDWQDEKKGVQA